MKKEEFLQRTTEALIELLGESLKAVALFGSRAREESRPKSDWDFFVIAEGLPKDPFDRAVFLREGLFKKGITGVSILSKRRDEFELSLRPIYLDIALDSIILYDQDGYLAKKLRKIEGIIQKKGLIRNMKRGSWIWEWEISPPPGRWEVDWER